MTIADLKPVEGLWYTASFHAPSRQIRIVAKGPFSKTFYMFTPMVSACDGPDARDVTGEICDIAVRRRAAKKDAKNRDAKSKDAKSGGAKSTTIVTFVEKSSLWARKEYTIEFSPETIKYSYRVFGSGPIGRAYLLRSWMKEAITVEEELGVVPGFETVFSPSVNFMGKVRHFAGDTSIITAGDDPMYWGSGLVCAPYCFCLNDPGDKLWVWAGLGVKPGQYTFDEFTWNSNVTKRIFGAGGFDCNYHGKALVKEGEGWQSPTLIIGAANDPYEGLEKYVGVLGKDYGLPKKKLPPKGVPSWWKSPIFCGWGEQMSLGYKNDGNVEGVNVDKYCTQAAHDEWLDICVRHDIRPGQIIIDAGWQKPGTTGDMYVDEARWPDLRGWIEQRRKEGIRTILWMCAWNRQGVPDDECITRDGQPVNVDPTNPRYEQRLRAMIRRLISDEEGCFNADGVKIDGEMGCPTGAGLKNCGDVWGLELQRCYMQIVHSEVKKHKKDAVCGTFMANPYLADLSDVVRTADMFSMRGDPARTLIHRAKILSIGQPGCPIDTDHCFWYDQRDNWIDIMQTQLACGIPCLYHIKYVWHKRPFAFSYIEEMTDEHYKAVSKAFNAYWKKLHAEETAIRKRV
jgi:hypothetical protein